MSLLAFMRMVRTGDIQGGEPVSVDEVVANGEKVLGSTRVIRKFALGGAGRAGGAGGRSGSRRGGF